MKAHKHTLIPMTILVCLCMIIQGCGKGGSRHHKQRGLDYYSRGMHDKAIEEFNNHLDTDPTDAEARYNLGLAYYANGMQKEAAAELKKAVEMNPNFIEDMDDERRTATVPTPKNVSAFNQLGLAYADKGMFDRAIATYKTALRINPDDAELHYNLALAYRGKGLTDKAMDEYRKVIVNDPTHVEAHYNLAVAYRNKGMTQPAILEFNLVLTLLSPKQKKRLAATHLNLGKTYIAEGGVDTAIEEYKKALELYPNYQSAKAALQNAYNKKRPGIN